MKNNKKKGFTLVELLVVIAILAILATVSTVGYTAFVTKARESVAQTEFAQITKIISTDLMDDGQMVITVADGDNKGTYKITDNGTTLAVATTDGNNALTVGQVLMLHEDIATLGATSLTLDAAYNLTFVKTYDSVVVTVTDSIE